MRLFTPRKHARLMEHTVGDLGRIAQLGVQEYSFMAEVVHMSQAPVQIICRNIEIK